MKYLPEAIDDVRYEKLPFTWNGYEFYRKNGIIRVRQYFDRHTREALLYDPKLVNVRKSNREFAICSTTSKIFRLSIAPALQIRFPYFHSCLNGFFRRLLNYDLIHTLGERKFSFALYHSDFLKDFAHFSYSPKADYWLSDVIPAISINRAAGSLEVDTSMINFDNLEKFIRFEIVVGEVIFNWEKLDYSHSFTGFRVYFHEQGSYRLEPEFQAMSKTQTHFYIAGILAQPDFDLSRKRSTQIEEYLGLKVFLL